MTEHGAAGESGHDKAEGGGGIRGREPGSQDVISNFQEQLTFPRELGEMITIHLPPAGPERVRSEVQPDEMAARSPLPSPTRQKGMTQRQSPRPQPEPWQPLPAWMAEMLGYSKHTER
jgi:hypothetical protein